MSQRNKAYQITKNDQLSVLASPVRQEILDALTAMGPSSAAELGSRLGRAPDSLYHHLRLLVRSDLVVEHGRRRTTYRTEVIYAPVRLARRFTANVDTGSPASLKNWQRGVATCLRLGIADFRRALLQRPIVTKGAARNLWCGRIKAYLSKKQLARVNALADELFDMLSRATPVAGDQLYAVTCLIVPARRTDRTRSHSNTRSRRSSSAARRD